MLFIWSGIYTTKHTSFGTLAHITHPLSVPRYFPGIPTGRATSPPPAVAAKEAPLHISSDINNNELFNKKLAILFISPFEIKVKKYSC